MTKKASLPRDADTATGSLSVERLEALAGRVHTYESFGRAIVADALTQAAAGNLVNGTLQASIRIRPQRRSAAADDPGSVVGGATGVLTPDPPYCTAVIVVIGGSSHILEVCYP